MEEEVCGMSRMKSKFYFAIKLLWFPALITRLFRFKTLILSAFLFWFLTRLDIHFAKAHPAEGVSEGEKIQWWVHIFHDEIRSLVRWTILYFISSIFYSCLLQKLSPLTLPHCFSNELGLGLYLGLFNCARITDVKAGRQLNSRICREAAQTTCATQTLFKSFKQILKWNLPGIPVLDSPHRLNFTRLENNYHDRACEVPTRVGRAALVLPPSPAGENWLLQRTPGSRYVGWGELKTSRTRVTRQGHLSAAFSRQKNASNSATEASLSTAMGAGNTRFLLHPARSPALFIM